MVIPVSMVADDDHRRAFAREREERLKHHVVEAVDSNHAVLVCLEILLRDGVHLRRMELHELVAEAIDSLVVHRHEVPVAA